MCRRAAAASAAATAAATAPSLSVAACPMRRDLLLHATVKERRSPAIAAEEMGWMGGGPGGGQGRGGAVDRAGPLEPRGPSGTRGRLGIGSSGRDEWGSREIEIEDREEENAVWAAS